jgi:dolichyl-phosphate-mannose-protein mannosyltransferase
LSDYASLSTNSTVAATQALPPPADVKVEEKIPVSEKVTPQASSDVKVVPGQKIEYRDQDGNLLDEELVKKLSGKVSFSTRYETRTKVLDHQGQEVDDAVAGSVAPPHPDVDMEPNTKGSNEEEKGEPAPASVSPDADLAKEKIVNEQEKNVPKPASEKNQATKGEL